MAQLQWRDVNAPDFSGSAEGFRTFSNLLDSAFGGLKQSVNQFDATQTNRVNQELMRTAMGITDAAEFEAALPGMLQDPRAARLTPENLAALGSRTNALLQTEGNRLQNTNMSQDMDFQQLERGRTQEDWAAEDAVQPFASEALRFRASGNDAEAAAVWARPEAQAALGQMDPDKARAIMSGEFQIGADRRGLRDSDLTYESTLFDFNETKEGAAAVREAETVLADLLPRVTTLQEAESMIYGSAVYRGLSTRGKLAADAMIRSRLPAAAPAIAGAAGAGGGGSFTGGETDALNIVNYEARGRGFTTVPSNIENYDQLQRYGRQMVAGTNGEGSSATGPFQITYSTRDEFAARALGANWRNLPRSVANEDKIAEAIFNDSRGSAAALRARWVSLSPAEAERVRRLPWAQAREVIVRGESGVDLSTLNSVGNAAQAQINDQRARSPTEDLLVGYAAAARVNMSPAAGADSLIAASGALAGAKRVDALEAINHVSERYGVTNSVAAALITNNTNRHGLGIFDWRRDMGGVSLDHAGIARDVALINNGGAQRGTVALLERETVSSNIETARAAAATAASELAAAVERQRSRPDYDISAFVRRDQQARQAFAMASAGSQREGIGYQPPVAPQAPVRPAPTGPRTVAQRAADFSASSEAANRAESARRAAVRQAQQNRQAAREEARRLRRVDDQLRAAAHARGEVYHRRRPPAAN